MSNLNRQQPLPTRKVKKTIPIAYIIFPEGFTAKEGAFGVLESYPIAWLHFSECGSRSPRCLYASRISGSPTRQWNQPRRQKQGLCEPCSPSSGSGLPLLLLSWWRSIFFRETRDRQDPDRRMAPVDSTNGSIGCTTYSHRVTRSSMLPEYGRWCGYARTTLNNWRDDTMRAETKLRRDNGPSWRHIPSRRWDRIRLIYSGTSSVAEYHSKPVQQNELRGPIAEFDESWTWLESDMQNGGSTLFQQTRWNLVEEKAQASIASH